MRCQVSTECWYAAHTGKGENTGSSIFLVYIAVFTSV